MSDFPSNLLVLATHGSYDMPDFLRRHVRSDFNLRLQRNFSDFITEYLIEDIPKDQCLQPKYGRIAGDLNRDKNGKEFVRMKDFGGVEIWKKAFQKEFHTKTEKWKTRLAKASYDKYYAKVQALIEARVKDPANKGKPIIMVDIHDTGNWILGRKKQDDRQRHKVTEQGIHAFKMPTVVLSNAQGATAPIGLLERFQASMVKHLEIPPEEVQINSVYFGGYLIRKFTDMDKNPAMADFLKQHKSKIYGVQIEMGRDFYMDERAQRVIIKKVYKTIQGMNAVWKDVAEFN